MPSRGPGVFQPRILEWIVISYSSGPSPHRYRTHVSCICYTGRRDQSVKNLPAMQETSCSAGNPGSIPELGWEDPLEKEIATHSSILAWEILGTEKPGGLQSMGSQTQDRTEQLNHHTWEARLI